MYLILDIFARRGFPRTGITTALSLKGKELNKGYL